MNISTISNETILTRLTAHDTEVARSELPASDDTIAAAAAVQPEEQVSLSPRTEVAAALLRGVAQSEDPASDPMIVRLAQSVSSGDYRPEAASVASAMLSFERRVARKLRRE